MWGREMRAALVFVLLSLVAGGAFREWRRSNEVRFADLVRELETGEARQSGNTRAPETGSAIRTSLEVPAGGSGSAATGDASSAHRSRARPAPALRPGAIDVDRASGAELERLPGIGPALAARIVAERTRNGPFRGADQLLRVPGIGPRTLERIRPYLSGPPAPADSGSPIAN